MYIAVGDAHNGDYSKPHNLDRAHKQTTRLRKSFVSTRSQRTTSPTIPTDNPYGTEVYATGLRDAQWFSFAKDLDGETVLIARHRALLVEEINIVRAKGNWLGG